MCGEHNSRPTDDQAREGSSPHVRGARWCRSADGGWLGIIPACAGSTVVPQCGWWLVGDHPRMCGEHSRHAALTFERVGSSPHVRGAPPAGTPTSSRSRDHPRMCGEHPPYAPTGCAVWGSSPHVRGALYSCIIVVQRFGIIPACAGSTIAESSFSCSAWDHPRMCGEHSGGF